MKKYVAECIGTATLVFMGCGSIVFVGAAINGGHLAVALTFGLTIIAMAYVIGGVSGCHINPAVSLAMYLVKKLNMSDFVKYSIAQIFGAIIGALLLRVIITTSGFIGVTGGLGTNSYGNFGTLPGLLIEIILTFIFVYTTLGVTSNPAFSSIAGIVIGLTLIFVHIVGIPLTGTSVNPARSIGPALLSGSNAALRQLWVFIVGPLAGASLAALAFKSINIKVANHAAKAGGLKS